MSETYLDQTGSRESNDETNRQLKRIAAGIPPKDPAPDWQLSNTTKELGKAGIADSRTILDIKRKQHGGEALSPQEVQILTDLHQQEHQE